MIRLRARAKINPYLSITGTRADGYHELSLIFMPVSLSDYITLEKNDEKRLVLTCSADICPVEDNIAVRAYDRLRDIYPDICGLNVHIEKNIPAGAGMGGGSADAAAFLKGVNEICGLGLNGDELSAIGVKLGADVPAMLLGKISHGLGIGEELSVINTNLKMHLLIVKPGFSCSTREMYGAFDSAEQLMKPGTLIEAIGAIRSNDPKGLCGCLYNVFEELLPKDQSDIIKRIKKDLLVTGADGALMTGSGSCVFGVFGDERSRDASYEALINKYDLYKAYAGNDV